MVIQVVIRLTLYIDQVISLLSIHYLVKTLMLKIFVLLQVIIRQAGQEGTGSSLKYSIDNTVCKEYKCGMSYLHKASVHNVHTNSPDHNFVHA